MARDDDMQVVDEDLLPDGASLDDVDSGGDDFDITELRVDFSEKESSSEARDFEPLPSGKYLVAVTEITIQTCGPKSKNPGKKFYNLQLTVQEGKYENRKLFANVMLFNGALYSLVQILKAMGLPYQGSGVKVPTPEQLEGEQFIVSVQKMVDKYKMDKEDWDPKEPKPFKNEVKSFAKAPNTGSMVQSGGNDLMP